MKLSTFRNSILLRLGVFSLALGLISVVTYKPRLIEPTHSITKHSFGLGLSPLYAQSNTTRFFSAYATESITIDNTSGGVAFTASKVTPTTSNLSANLVSFRVECSSGTSCPMRFTLDGTTVTSSVGFLVDYGDIVNVYNYVNITRFKGIRTGSTSAVIQPIYWN